MDNIDTIFVDCFNTVILRKLSTRDIFFEWTKMLGEHYAIQPKILFDLFKKYRRKIGISGFFKERKVEVKFEDIISAMCSVLKLNIDNFNEEDFSNVATELYSLAEMKNHYLNTEVFEKLINFKQQGKKIYLVSDFYCGKETVARWLKNVGALSVFDELFVSHDCNHNKSSGGLFPYVVKQLNVDRKKVLMIGDNRHSDCLMSAVHGIKSMHIEKHKAKSKPETTFEIKHGINYKEYDQIFKTFGKEYGFSNHAFPLFLFMKRLYQNLVKNDTKNVFFLARDGYFLKVLFDKYLDTLKVKYKKEIDITTHYMQASRNSVLSAGLESLENEDFHYLFRASKSMSIKKFLKTLGFKNEDVETIISELNLPDKKIKKIAFSKEFKALKENETFKKLYEEKRIVSKQGFDLYLDSFGVDVKKEGLCIVDIGWKGTMQSLFNKIFKGSVKVTGYNLGSYCGKEIANEMFGLLYDKNNKKQYGNSLLQYTIFNYEQICRSNHNRCDGYEVVDGKANLIFDTTLKDSEIYQKLTYPLQKQIIDKFEKIAKLDYLTLDYTEKLACTMYKKLNKKKSKQDWDWLMRSQNSHHDNFGDSRYPFKMVVKGVRLFGFKLLDMLFLLKYMFLGKYYKTKLKQK